MHKHHKLQILLIAGVVVFVAGCSSNQSTPEGDENLIEPPSNGGTWTDPTTGYVWQNPPTEYTMTWDNAVDYCKSLNLDGKQWHLPTISELRSLIRDCAATQTGGSCGVTDICSSSPCSTSACIGCGGKSFYDCYWDPNLSGAYFYYWSASSYADSTGYAWGVNFHNARVNNSYKAYYNSNVRCVRAGP